MLQPTCCPRFRYICLFFVLSVLAIAVVVVRHILELRAVQIRTTSVTQPVPNTFCSKVMFRKGV